MCKFIGRSNEQILCKLSKSEILRLYSIVHVAMEAMKTSHFTFQSKSFISISFPWKVSACELQPFSCHDLANDMYSQTAKIVFSRLNKVCFFDNDNSMIKNKLNMAATSYHPRILIPKYGQTDNVKPLTAVCRLR